MSSLLKSFDFLVEFLSKGTDEILRKIAKWDIKDILIDIDNINNEPKWKPFLRKHFGKENIEIKDLENWDLSKYLKDI
jgi:hypothetical protein